jgi:hypothetical protein
LTACPSLRRRWTPAWRATDVARSSGHRWVAATNVRVARAAEQRRATGPVAGSTSRHATRGENNDHIRTRHCLDSQYFPGHFRITRVASDPVLLSKIIEKMQGVGCFRGPANEEKELQDFFSEKCSHLLIIPSHSQRLTKEYLLSIL